MTQSTLISRLSRLGLLSVLCAGLFFTSGELNMSNDGDVQIGNGGIYAAAAEGTPAKTESAVDTSINAAITTLNTIMGILTFLITPLIMLAGWHLSPDWTMGEVFGLRPIIHQIWILISNVVYVIFGFMLVFVAFANIFGGESAKTYEMGKYLPKLLTGMLIVPFTWFIVSAVLSVSNVLTASVIQLPVETIKKAGEASGVLKEKIIPKTIYYIKGADFGSGTAGNGMDTEGEGSFSRNKEFAASNCSGGKNPDCLSIEEFLNMGGGGAYNLLSVYAYGIFKIQNYKQITVDEQITKTIDIVKKLGFGIIFFIMFGILILTIVYALFSRAIMLWLYAMFSPLFALNYVMDFKGDSLKNSVGKLSVTKFISLAMVPVYVSAALAFGLMFLGLVMNATGSTDGKGDTGKLQGTAVEINTDNATNTTVFKFGTNDNAITLTTVGLLDEKSKSGTTKALDLGRGVIGSIILNVLALVILWMAVMAALGADDVTKAAVKPIADFGHSIGELAMKAPQYVPIPLPGGKNINMAGIGNMGQQINSTISSAAGASGTEFGQTFGKGIANAIGLHVNPAIQNIEKAIQNNGGVDKISGFSNPKEKNHATKNILGSIGGNTKENIEDVQTRSKIVDYLQKVYKLDDSEAKKLLEANNTEKFNTAVISLAGRNNDIRSLIGKEGTGNITDLMGGPITTDGKNATNNVTSTSNITIAPKEGGSNTNYTITIGDKSGEFDLSKGVSNNADSLSEVSGKMTEGEFETEMKKHMKPEKVTELIKELKGKTPKFFKP